MTGQQHPWRPTRRRLGDTVAAALAPVTAASLALAGLTSWVAAGRAGSPAEISVTSGRVLLPTGGSGAETAAFFDITNSGGADDRLLSVTSPRTGEAALSRHRRNGTTAAYRDTVPSTTVRAGTTLSMSPSGLDVTLRPRRTWQAGDLVPFTLHFEHSGPVRTLAVVVGPAGRTF